MESFPYKREFYKKQICWENAKNKDYTFEEQRGDQLIFVTKETAYDEVNVLTDLFTEEERLKCSIKTFDSPIVSFEKNKNDYLSKIREIAKNYPGKTKRYVFREVIYLNTKECTNFKITLTQKVFSFFKSKRVLDPSAGWGDRLLGALTSTMEVYHATDPNVALQKSYKEIIDLAKSNRCYTIAEVFPVDFLKKTDLRNDYYDTVFTSPPFFDYEIYSKEKDDSLVKYSSDLKKWKEDFMLPYVRKCFEHCKREGFVILYMSDVGGAKYMDDIITFVEETLGYKLSDKIGTRGEKNNKIYPLWVWKKI